jgi:hypothetical protein
MMMREFGGKCIKCSVACSRTQANYEDLKDDYGLCEERGSALRVFEALAV